MSGDHISFYWDLSAKLGPPLFSGTLVACLLSELAVTHIILLGVGLLMIGLSHWHTFHSNH